MTLPTFRDGPPVPMMVEGQMDATTLTRMFGEIENAGILLGIRQKGEATEYTGNDTITLTVALERLLSGSARAIQLRYRFDGYEWTDTVMASMTGFRVVRCRHE